MQDINVNEDPSLLNDDDSLDANAKIKVIGVGGGGSNAVNQMINDKSDLIDYWVFNTDSQALAASQCPNKYVLGKNVTRGLGAGGDPAQGEKAAKDSYNDIQLLVKGADLVFLACGEGGGTGTGATPVIAKAAKDAGALVLAVVTRPFNFEGKRREVYALKGIETLKESVDAMIVVSNDKIIFNKGKMSIKQSFTASDKILALAVKTITDIILLHGQINLDYADVKATLKGKGLCLIGIGEAEGENKAVKAAQAAINSPLLETSIKGAKTLMINVTTSEDDTSMDEINYAISYIKEACSRSEDVDVVFGLQYDNTFKDKIKFAVIATDFDKSAVSEVMTPKPLRRSVSVPKSLDIVTNPTESKTVQEMHTKKTESPLPDYLREFLVNEEKKEEKPSTEESKKAPEEEKKPVQENKPVSAPKKEPERSIRPRNDFSTATLTEEIKDTIKAETIQPKKEEEKKDGEEEDDADDDIVIDPSEI